MSAPRAGLRPARPPRGTNPTLALEQDLELVQWLDSCGYDEAWCGEHHSACTETSASPEIFMAVASQRTRHIKLGTGVVSVSYHNPLWVAERIVQLDHLTRGRVMLGVGPGSLPSDGISTPPARAATWWRGMSSRAGRARWPPRPRPIGPAQHGPSWPRSTARRWRRPPSAVTRRPRPEAIEPRCGS